MFRIVKHPTNHYAAPSRGYYAGEVMEVVSTLLPEPVTVGHPIDVDDYTQ